MSEKLLIYGEPVYDRSIRKEEKRYFYPHSKSFNNNDEIEIDINQQDILFSFYESDLYIEGNFTTTGENGEVFITNNMPAFLFDNISYELNGFEIEKVRDPGITTLLKSFLCYNNEEVKTLQVAGFIWPYNEILPSVNEDGNFSFLIPLPHLFGCFHDYQRVLRGQHKFRFVRSRTDNNCFQTVVIDAGGGGVHKKVSFTLKTVAIASKQIYPSDLQKLDLLRGLKQDKPIKVPFRKWDLYELPHLTRGNREIWTVKTSPITERPRFVIIAFQGNRKDNHREDATKLDHMNIVDLKVYINSQSYPYEQMNLDFAKKRYTEIYKMYSEFQSQFYWNRHQCQPLLDYASFKERTMFVIDTSRYNEDDNVPSSTCNLRVEFQSSADFPNKTKAYCLVIHDSVFEYKPLTTVVRHLL
jgi:hypothetical protein